MGLHRGAAGRGRAPLVDDLPTSPYISLHLAAPLVDDPPSFELDEVALLRLPCQNDRAHLAHGPRSLLRRAGRVPLG